jgi:hypothetical protein
MARFYENGSGRSVSRHGFSRAETSANFDKALSHFCARVK